MKNKNIIIIVLAVICCLLLGAVGYTMLNDKKQEEKATSESDSDHRTSQSGTIVVDGVEYRPNTNLQTVLFMGIDRQEKVKDGENRPGENGQSDSLNLLVADRETGKAQILQISRDSMVEIDIYSASGEKMMSEQGQIALQYAYGDGEELSCRLTAEKVSELLYGVDIQSYLSLTLEGMIRTADAIGGVTVTIPEDYTDIDPAFVKGETVTMNGDLVEKYVRTRDIDVLESNVDRMKRQQQFMSALIEKLQGMQGSTQYMSLYQQMEPYMVTNMTADEMKALSEYEIDSDTLEVPGEIIYKDGHAQFIVDNKSLQEIVLKTFYKSN
ncbi:LCP family protein [Bariatricus sp. HCP28S3_A7]|uniref:LCP family protein n=1 Tax=Bariatricus sp. HCP28S3_A7 TaxID=3438894 RepID=UPI003F8A0162